MPGPHDRVFARLEALREDMTQALSRLIQAPSVRDASPNRAPEQGEGVREALGVIHDLCVKAGLRYREVAGEVGIAEMGPEGEHAAALLHVDVVPPGDGWDHPPFSGVIVNGEVWGRGAQDDKGPAISVLWAAQAVLEAGPPLRRGFRIIFGTDEESGIWTDMDAYLAAEPLPLMGFVPDGQFPIAAGEKGFVNVEVVASGETSAEGSLRLDHLSAGDRPNIVPDRALALVCANGDLASLRARLAQRVDAYNRTRGDAKLELQEAEGSLALSATGKAAHGSLPHEGHSALLDLVDFLDAEDLGDSGPARMVRFLADRVRFDLCGERLGVFGSHEFVGFTTVNVGLVETDGDGTCRATLNVRIPYGMTQADVVAGVRDAASQHSRGTGSALSASKVGRGHDPLYVDVQSELVRGLARAYETATGRPAGLESIGGTTFAKSMPSLVAFGPNEKGDPELAHQANERVSVEVLVRNARVYAAAILELCADV